MNTTSQHIPFTDLADLAENRTAPDERSQLVTHISTCTACGDELNRLERILLLMRTDKEPDAPRDLIAFAVNIFAQREVSGAPSLLRRIVAALTFDSSANLAPAFGVRSGQVASRQLIYSAAGKDVDLRLTPLEDQWVIAGQLLGEDCEAGEVRLEGETGTAVVRLNELCEFTLPPMPSGNYTLFLRLGNIEVEVPQLELKS
ncbi:MAG: hypothetical protein QOH71_2480 [Blastocatellia bacterium]|jgi:hypothetical protein|nr:hypothetical protein [Blastocatellia bacterium]